MIISRNLLAQYFPAIKGMSYEEISDVLFKAGIDIEGFEKIHTPTKLYYGFISFVAPVAGSTKLKLCDVFIPVKQETFQIVCGANNVRNGIKVVVALPGAQLMNGELSIFKRKFSNQGIESDGMICGYSELFKSDILKNVAHYDSGNIIELDVDMELGEFSVNDLWLDDWIFDLSIPSNRGDLHSAWGISREMAKIIGKEDLELRHGCLPKEGWDMKKVLLMNNQIPDEKHENNIQKYLLISFNEVTAKSGDKSLIRKKPKCFHKLALAMEKNAPNLKFALKRVMVDSSSVLNFLGLPSDWRKRTDFFVLKDGEVFVPEWREDVQKERDVVDEVLSIIGWNTVQSRPIKNVICEPVDNQMVFDIERIRELWKNYGFFECTTFNLHESTPNEPSVTNPVSTFHVSLRKNAILELIRSLENNYRGKNPLRPVFEIFERNTKDSPEWVLNVVVPERKSRFPMGETNLPMDIYDLQALLRRTFAILKGLVRFDEEVTECPLTFLKGSCLRINGSSGHMGFLNTSIPVVMWGFYVVLKPGHERTRTIQTPSKYPSSYKDVCIELPKSTEVKLKHVISIIKCDDLVSVDLVDKYETNSAIRYLFRIRLQSRTRTLSGDEIHSRINEVLRCLSQVPDLTIK